MFILEKEMLRLIKEEADKALREVISTSQIKAIQKALGDAGKSADEVEDIGKRLDDFRKQNQFFSLDDEFLEDIFTDNISDIEPDELQNLVKKVKGADAPEPTAPKPRPATDAASDVAGEEASEFAGKSVEEIKAEIQASLDAALGESPFAGKTNEQIRQEVAEALAKGTDGKYGKLSDEGIDELAKKLDIDFGKFKKVLKKAGLVALAGAALSGSTPTTAGAPSGGGRAGGRQPTSAAGTAAAGAAGSTGDAGWDKYLRGSEYVTPDQAKQVYDAWVAFVDSQGLKEQTGGVDKSFASYKSWWETNYGNKKLGKYGGVSDTIRYLKSLTKKPQDSSTTAAPTTPAASVPAASGPVELDAQAQKQMDYYNREKTRLEKMLNDYNDQIASLLSANTDLKRGMPEKSQFANIMPTPDGVEQIETVKPGTGPRRVQFNKNAQTMINLANAANKAKGVLASLEDYKKNIPVMMKKRQAQQAEKNTISESVYSRWQKIIKG